MAHALQLPAVPDVPGRQGMAVALGMSVHSVAPLISVSVPEAHDVHFADPDTALNDIGGHGVHPSGAMYMLPASHVTFLQSSMLSDP